MTAAIVRVPLGDLGGSPMSTIGGLLRKNAFEVPPDDLLKELKERAADGTT